VEINHGGYFVGSGRNKNYVSGHKIWFDHVDSVTWSPLIIEKLVEDMGYEMCGRIKVYFCLPHLDVSTNGLIEITDDAQTQAMLQFLGKGQHLYKLMTCIN
jgi:hypothetical protein